jgi:hypothetical protein
MLLWFAVLILGEGGGGGEPIGPEPDASTSGFSRRRMASYVKRGGVGALRGRIT